MPDGGEITALLQRLNEASPGDRKALLARLIPLVYGELKALARANRYRWAGEPSAGTTSLVHEVYARLAGGDPDYPGRRQFFSLASKAMRSVLIDNARHHQRLKRGGGVEARQVAFEAFGARHPLVLEATEVRALALEALGLAREAGGLVRGLLPAVREVLGAEHPQTRSVEGLARRSPREWGAD